MSKPSLSNAFFAALLILFAATASAFDGAIDTSFGDGGVSVANVADGNGTLPRLVVQADGKIVMCQTEGTSTPSSRDFLVTRYLSDGGLDPSFSFDGKVTIDFAGGDDLCGQAALQSDGKIVLAGSSRSNGRTNIAIARLNADGTLDSTFGEGNGKATVSLSNDASANALVIAPDGRLVLAGTIATNATGGSVFVILRLTKDGALDSTFNGGDALSVAFHLSGTADEADAAFCVALDDRGGILAAGYASHFNGVSYGDHDFAIVRVLADGQLDQNFNADGRAVVAFNRGGANGNNDDLAFHMILQRDGRIVLAGTTDSSTDASTPDLDMAFARLLPDGSLDPGFGDGGKVVVPFNSVANSNDEAAAIAEQSDGKLVAAGLTTVASQPGSGAPLALGVALLRMGADGSLDTTFGNAGKIAYPISLPNANWFASTLAFQNGNIIIGGPLDVGDQSPPAHDDFFVARLLDTQPADDTIFKNGFDGSP